MKIKMAELEAVKKYKLENIININEKEERYIMNFELGYLGEKLEFYSKIESSEENAGTINYFLNRANEVFNIIIYKLLDNGEIKEVFNTIEILNKWNKIKKEFLQDDKNKEIFDSILELNGLVVSKEKLSDLLKKYNIVPYLTLGFYNKELSTIRPLRLEGILYNMYLMENIPVQYEIYGEVLEDKQIVKLKGKDRYDFDRTAYKNKILSNFQDTETKKIGAFDLKCDGEYIFNLDNSLKSLNFEIIITIPNLINCKYTYIVKESEE